jgi:predicted ATPase/DNA-binding winged helix-turn-helix (wHTH) protein
MVSFGYVRVDLERGRVERPEGAARLTRTELRALRYLVEREERPVTVDELLVDVWGYKAGVRSRTVITTISRLRAKIEADPARPRFLVTVPDGYLLQRSLDEAPRGDPRRDFVGRVDELEAIAAAFASGARIVTLVGPGGAGKTRLAGELLSRWRETSRPVVVDLVPVTDPDDVASVLAGALGLSRGGGLESALTAQAPLTVLLDNAEHVAAGGAAAARRCAAVDGIRVLVTSREALRVPGEHVVGVGPLPARDAVALLVDRARGARADGELLERAGALLDRLVEHLDGLPLAIELAAPLLATLSPTELLERMPRRLRLFADPERASRHGTLAAAVGSSWELLDDGERRVLAQLSVFVAGFGVDAVERVVDGPPEATLQVVDALRRRSLLQVSASAERTRYRLLLAIRDFAGERLRELGDEAATRMRWRQHAARVADACREGFDGPEHRASVDRLGLEHEDLLAAARSEPTSQEALRIALALGIRSWRMVHDRRVSALLETLDVTAAGAELEVELRVCRAELAFAEGRDGHPDLAAAETRAVGTLLLEAKVARRRGVREGIEGHVAEAEATLEHAIDVARVAGSLADEGASTIDLAMVLRHRGKAPIAFDRLAAIEPALARGGHARVHAGVLATMGSIGRSLGRGFEAELHLLRALAAYERLGEEENAAVVLVSLGNLCYVQGRLDEAMRLFRRALVVHRQRGSRRAEAFALASVGCVALARRSFAEAEALLLEAAAMNRENGTVTGEAYALGLAARARHAAGDLAVARARYADAAARFGAAGMRHRALQLDGLRAAAEAELGEATDPWASTRAGLLAEPGQAAFVELIDGWILAARDPARAAELRAQLATPAFDARYLEG